MRAHRWIIALLIVGGCGRRTATSSGPPAAPPPDRVPGSAPPPVDAAPAPPLDAPAAPPPPALAGRCAADAAHCCRADGAIVRPGGCQPSYPDDVAAATTRGPDGFCVAIECHLRCLPADARIATPDGETPVSELRRGDVVWTLGADGARRAAPVMRMATIPIVGDHTVIELMLADGRRVRASAGHPLTTGALVGDLGLGAVVDGSPVVAIRPRPYRGATWDLLPAGPTGAYWADGVLLGSTLAP